jgi:3-deoxy-manno-octulosonate cytidylyltransferase (CMP-KDO synthetase)
MVDGVLDKKIIGVIPARYQSSRLPGKPLKDIYGKPMIYWVAKRVEASMLTEYYVATDDERIFDTCQKYALPCIMTSSDCINGTERVAEVATKIKADYYVNIQGDEPCISIEAINKTIQKLSVVNDVDFIQAVSRMYEKDDHKDLSIVKVAISDQNYALYYSRLPIPFSRDKGNDFLYRCLGLYLYSSSFLKKYAKLPPTKLEKLENIEQLRILESGIRIDVVEVEDDGISVDTPDDLYNIRNQYKRCFNIK